MDSNNYISTEGIVLSEFKYKETSKIINIFTKELGKINLFATGAFRPGSSMLLSTTPLSISRFILKKRGRNLTIADSSIVKSNIDLGKHPEKFMIAKIIAEIVEKTTLENYKDERLYNLITTSINNILTNKDPIKIKLAFLIKYLSFIGYRPDLEFKNMNDNVVFSYNKGKIIKKSDIGNYENFINVDKRDIISLNSLLYSKISLLDEIEVYNIDKIDTLLMNFLYTVADVGDLKSQKLYDELF